MKDNEIRSDDSRNRTPFKIGQSVDDVLTVLKKTGRRRLAIRMRAKEGTLTVDLRRRKGRIARDADVTDEMKDAKIDVRQNITTWYYLSDCTLKFKRYRGLSGKEGECYRIVAVEGAEDVDSIVKGGVFIPSTV